MKSHYLAGVQPNAITSKYPDPRIRDAWTVQMASGIMHTRCTAPVQDRGQLATLLLASFVMLCLGIVKTMLIILKGSPGVLDSFSLIADRLDYWY